MTVVTVRPDATVASSGITVVGAASIQAALSDNSDSSYIYGVATAEVRVGFAEPTLPPGAVLKNVSLRGRAAITQQNSMLLRFVVWLNFPVSGHDDLNDSMVSWGTPTTWVAVPAFVPRVSPSQIVVSVEQLGGSRDWVRIYELYADATYVATPVVSVVAPAPGATITDTNLPTISWSNTLDADGGPQAGYKVRVYSQAQYTDPGFDPTTAQLNGRVTPVVGSGTNEGFNIVSGSDTSWTPSTVLPDDTYRAFVQVFQLVNGQPHVSDWAFSEFTIEVDVPGVPLVVVDPLDSQGVNRVQVTCDSSDVTSTDLLEAQYSYDGGTTWAPLRTAEGDDGRATPVNDAATLWDFESPNGVEATYRVRSLHNYSGAYAASEWVEASGMWSSTQEWLVNPLDPSMNLRITIEDFAARQRTGRRGAFQPLGTARIITVTDRRSSRSGSVVLMVDEADHASLDALLDAGVPLLLRGAAGSAMPFPLYISVGDTDRVEASQKGFDTWTRDAVNWVEAARPLGGLLTVPV